MVLIVYTTIRDYLENKNSNQSVKDVFANWRLMIEKNDFANLNELKEIFNTVDYIRNDRYVFNISGNKYRLVTMIHFNIRTIYVLFVGTHKEYDRIDAKNIKYKK
ncbi:MAG TPA: type II toxin-antitoxin system HigB family toxin [Hanamia sp.]